MDYIALLKKAYKVTIQNKFLWIFGIFAGGMSFMGGFNSLSGLGSRADMNRMLQPVTETQVANYLSQHAMLFLSIALFVILFMVLMFMLSLLSQGSLIGGVEKINRDEKVNFFSALKIGTAQFWRLWGLIISYSLIMLIALIVLGLPALFFATSGAVILAIAWGFLALIIILVLSLIIGIISPYSYRILILENKTITQSIRAALHFVRDKLLEVVLVYISLMVVSIVFGFVLAFALILVAGVLVLIGIGIWTASAPLGAAYMAVAGLAFLIGLFSVGGAYSAFQSAVLTLAYHQLKRS